MASGAYSRPETRRPGVLSARRDAVVLAILITAVLLLIWNGSSFFHHININGESYKRAGAP